MKMLMVKVIALAVFAVPAIAMAANTVTGHCPLSGLCPWCH